MAGYIMESAQKCESIGFCFSYPTEILPSRDGILLQFCKEVQAPGVVGQLVGKRLLEALGTPHKSIVLLNDTVATLLAGKSASISKKYDSYIGFILGTGTNTCYIEKNSNITKTGGLDQVRNMIINIESGNFGKPPRTDLDIKFDNTTMNPGNYGFEKMFSGGYIGGLCLTVLKSAAEEGLFSPEASEKVLGMKDLSSNHASSFAADPGSEGNGLSKCFTLESDKITARLLIDTLIDRAAKLVAGNIAAVLLKTEKGNSPDCPVLITIEGTAFYKLHKLKPSFEKYMKEYLSGEKQRYYEFTEVQQSSLVGAGLAALIG